MPSSPGHGDGVEERRYPGGLAAVPGTGNRTTVVNGEWRLNRTATDGGCPGPWQRTGFLEERPVTLYPGRFVETRWGGTRTDVRTGAETGGPCG